MKELIRKILPKEIFEWIRHFYHNNFIIMIWGFFYNYKNYKKRHKNRVYLIGTTNHNNLGDHAISYAEILYCKKNLAEYQLVEVTDKDFYKHLLCLYRYITPNDLIFLHGGGNMGIEYYYHEVIRRKIIRHFIKNIIVIFPQTIDFGHTRKGAAELRKSARIYNNHKKLCLLTREKYSYDIAKKYFNQITNYLIPDIVLSLDQQKAFISVNLRDYILICLRNDCEKNISNDQKKWIIANLKSIGNCRFIDMIIDRDLSTQDREVALVNHWEIFCGAKFVVTDRLHGMVFSFITGTPCLVLPNYNYKVSGTYEWLKEYPSIQYFEGEGKSFKNEFTAACQSILDFEQCKYDKLYLENKYKLILAFLNNKKL